MTGICAFGVRSFETPRTRDCRSSCAVNCIARRPQRLEASWRSPTKRPESCRSITSRRAIIEPAWRFAPVAAKRAEGAFAYVEAAGLYARAVEAAKRLPDVPRHDLALVCRALGDAWLRATEYQKASAAFVLARRVNAGTDPVLESILLLFQSRVEEKMGQYQKALRWAARARRPLHDRTDTDALRQLARSNAWYATVLQFAGRPRDAVRCAERAVNAALPIEDHDALADAYLVIGWARGAQGLEGAERYWKLALESAERAGRHSLRPALLINLGLACQWKGHWDEAIDYYEQGRDESVRIGSNVNAMLARLNIAEILIERSEWTKANDLLRETLPFFKAARYRFFLAACLVLMGRVYLGMGRIGDAFAQLQESKRTFVEIGAADEIQGSTRGWPSASSIRARPMRRSPLPTPSSRALPNRTPSPSSCRCSSVCARWRSTRRATTRARSPPRKRASQRPPIPRTRSRSRSRRTSSRSSIARRDACRCPRSSRKASRCSRSSAREVPAMPEVVTAI